MIYASPFSLVHPRVAEGADIAPASASVNRMVEMIFSMIQKHCERLAAVPPVEGIPTVECVACIGIGYRLV
jgi:hypothetical protein